MATEKLSEQEIQLRKRARRRLVGAIALVLAMVVILPMVLDDRETKAPQPEIVVNIPNQADGDFAAHVNPATENTATQNPPQTATPETTTPEPETIPDSEAAPTSAVETAPTPAKPEAKNSETKKPEPTKPAKSETAKPDKKPATNAAFTIQIGVFSDAANLKQTQDKLAAAGYKPYTEKLNGSGTRLRLGAYATRDEAEKALGKIKATYPNAIIVPK
ncbi:MAG: SPOR domain-containing protein [Methylobacillus sp.]|jgi:DedD protein|nr:SPOR domain-containing protein [Methylobacillus sp.]